MGKVRVKTIGIEEEEKDQKSSRGGSAFGGKKARQNEAKKLAEKKRAEKQAQANAEETLNKTQKNAEKISEKVESETQRSSASDSAPVSDKKLKTKTKFKKQTKIRSSSYVANAKLIDKNKSYTLAEALGLLPKLKRAKFDETVELHINTNEQGVSGSLTLPNGTGKTAKIELADNTTDPKHVQELVKKIEGGQIDFDILIATPDTMTHLARVARFLGPRGLMPNPKNGTIHPKPKEAAKKFEGGQINFKTEAKAPIIHMSVGKLSFGEKNLNENIKTVLQAVKTQNIKNVTLKSTMSPGIKIAV